MAGSPTATTTDSLYGGAIALRQPTRGYRVNVDAVLLAAFAAQGTKAQFAIDLGAGVGPVALGLHHLGAATRFALVEREPSLLALAGENAERAAMNAALYGADLARGLPRELHQCADLVVSNPPFFDPVRTRSSREPAKARARFGDLTPFLTAAAVAVKGTRARAVFVYPARELVRFLSLAEQARLVPKRLRFVHAELGRAARVALIELRRAEPGGLEVMPPLLEWSAKGVRSPELARLLLGDTANAASTANDRR